MVRLRTIRLCARAGAHIECSSRLRAENVTITNVILKTPDRNETGVGMTSCPEARGWEFRWFLKKAVSWDLFLGEASWDLKMGKASPVYGLRDAHAFVGSVSWDSDSGPRVQLGTWLKDDVGTVSIVKIVCLPLLVSKKLKVKKKVINVSYLNYRESYSVFPCIWTFYVFVLCMCIYYKASINDCLAEILAGIFEGKLNDFESIMFKVSKEKLRKHEDWFDGKKMKLEEIINNRNKLEILCLAKILGLLSSDIAHSINLANREKEN